MEWEVKGEGAGNNGKGKGTRGRGTEGGRGKVR